MYFYDLFFEAHILQKVSFLYSLIKCLTIINKDLLHVKLRSVNYLTVKSLKLLRIRQEAEVQSLSLPSMVLPRIQIPSDNESIKTWSVRRSRLEVLLTYTHEPIYFQVIKSRAGTSWGRSCRHGRERENVEPQPGLSDPAPMFLSFRQIKRSL